ncbi:MAG: hypothetical protein Q9M36_11745 [Sulfurovum sp.]|nr:hypothetical protein [Sulfurovum sp.]
MSQTKKSTFFALAISLLYFQGCISPKISTPSKNSYSYSGVYFGKYFPKNYKKGIVDGCTTSKGSYKKSHTLFKKSKDYEEGWFLGRNKCLNLLGKK